MPFHTKIASYIRTFSLCRVLHSTVGDKLIRVSIFKHGITFKRKQRALVVWSSILLCAALLDLQEAPTLLSSVLLCWSKRYEINRLEPPNRRILMLPSSPSFYRALRPRPPDRSRQQTSRVGAEQLVNRVLDGTRGTREGRVDYGKRSDLAGDVCFSQQDERIKKVPEQKP